MKKQAKKLKLAKETVRSLIGVYGGVYPASGTPTNSCEDSNYVDCPWEHDSKFPTCTVGGT